MFENKRDASYLHTREAGALVPLIQSAVTGGLLGLVSLLVLLRSRVMVMDALFWSACCGLVVTTGMWLFLQRHWFVLTMERVTGMDLNQDGVVEPSNPVVEARRTVRVDIQRKSDDGHVQIVTARFPVPEWKMIELAKGLVAGKPFSERTWCGAKKTFSLREFRDVRDEMMRRELLKASNEKSNNQGYELTKEGWTVIRDLANSPAPGETVS